ncbi:MAG: hypothetical protein ACREL9_02650 [Gemmatimonadales bacterium]
MLLACHSATVPSAGTHPELGAAFRRDTTPLFQTDSVIYTLRADSLGYSADIRVRFTNRTSDTTYFVNCDRAIQVSLEKLNDGQWRAVWSPLLPLCLSPPIVVPPGGRYDTRIDVFGGYSGGNSMPQFSVGEVAGVYRAVWHDALRSYRDHPPFGEPLALEHRLSNRFAFRLQAR